MFFRFACKGLYSNFAVTKKLDATAFKIFLSNKINELFYCSGINLELLNLPKKNNAI